MTQELIWGKSGSPHIDGNDIGTINLAMRGVGNYVLDYKDKLKATVASANKVTIGTGVMSFEGRDIIISAAETVTIESGSQGMKRNDIICEHYHRDTSTGVETTNLVAIKGTPASSKPKDPTIPSGTILGGATDAYMPLWRVPLVGITVGTPVQLFEILTPLKTVGDSVTHRMVAGVFKRSDGHLAVNNGQTLMNVEITDKTIPGAYVTATGKGGEIRGLEPGNYLVFANLPLAADAGWYALSIDKTGNGVVIGTTVGEQLVGTNGYTRLNAVGFATITSETDGIWVRVDSNHDATMRSRGGIYITRIQHSVTQSIDAIKSQVYPDIKIGGRLRCGVATVQVFGSNVGFSNGVDSKIGEVTDAARPLIPVRVLAGIQDGSWILLVINVDGNIYITGKYGGGTVANLDISATYLAA